MAEKKKPQVMSTGKVVAHVAMFLAFSALFVLASIGLYCITETGANSYLAVTSVGRFFRWATSKNPASVAMAFNIGLFGTFFCVVRLSEHLTAAVELAKETQKKKGEKKKQ